MGEVCDRLAGDDLEHLARFVGEQVVLVAVGAGVAVAQACDLVVERRVDVQQRAGDVEQRTLVGDAVAADDGAHRSEEHTSELQSVMRISYVVFCWKKKKHS